GPVNLFQKHDADHLMRPGGGAERKLECSLTPQFGRKSVRAADCENSVLNSLVAPPRQKTGERGAVQAVAALVQCNQRGFLGNLRGNGGVFLRDPGWGIPRAAFRNFMNGEATKTGSASDLL